MTVSVQHFTNTAFGFPRTRVRRVKPFILACLHITGNSKTAAYPDAHKAAQGERNYANRAGSNGPSATHYVARDGWTIEALDWRRYAAWSNGDVSRPHSTNPGIAKVLALRAKGYNANEAYWLEIESVGYPRTYAITSAQKQACAERIADAARYSGLPVNRQTVHGHWEINGIDRQNCPDPNHEAFLNDVIARARAILAPPTSGKQMRAAAGTYRTYRVAVGTRRATVVGTLTTRGFSATCEWFTGRTATGTIALLRITSSVYKGKVLHRKARGITTS